MKLLIYPASKEVSAFARFNELITEYEEVSFCIPKGWADDGDDFSKIDGGSFCGVSVRTDMNTEMYSADGVYFANSPIQLRKEYILQKAHQAFQLGKKVYLDSSIESDRSVKSENITCLEGENYKFTAESTSEVCKFPVPVIFVLGAGPFTNKFEVQLALRKYFIKNKYRVTQIGSKRHASFFGFSSLPEAFFKNSLTIREKIIGLNRYFYQKFLQEKPDVMIIGIPGGIMPLSPVRFEELGEIAFLISQAISPDVSIFCSYLMNFTKEYLEKIELVCKYKLNAPISYFVISNTELELSMETRFMQYKTAEFQQIRKMCEQANKMGFRSFCGSDSSDLSELSNCVFQKLVNNF